MIRKLVTILLLFLLLLLIYTGLRTGFYYLYFRETVDADRLPAIFYWGSRLDFTALFYLHIIFLGYYFFISDMLRPVMRRRITLALLLAINIPFLAINFIDLVYYRFNLRRSNYDLLGVWWDSMGATGTFWKLFGIYFIVFVAVCILFVFLLLRLFPYEQQRQRPSYKKLFQQAWLPGLCFMLLAGGLARGIGGRPILPSTPLLYFPPEYQGLVTNSSYTFLYSLIKHQRPLQKKAYITGAKADSLFSFRRQYTADQPMQRKNVVIFMLESFCKEYFEPGSPYRGSTPFLDSIIAHSTWCSDAYANGLSSNQGIVALLGGMPPFMDEPYYHSAYSSNKIYGIGSLLKDKGYSTHFFMGAGPDHFGFGKYCHMLGIDRYHSGDDFGDSRYDDGVWGIYDHKFLPYAADILKKEKKPFFSVIFNLSSHPPFTIPPGMKQQFSQGGQQLYLQSTAYVDYSLRLFFDAVRNTDWYKNTLFVFVADHSVINTIRKENDAVSVFRIPLFIYDPANPVYQEVKHPVQQLDVLPTLLDRLNYTGQFLSFGRPLNDATHGCILNKLNDLYIVRDSCLLLQYNENIEQPVYLYNIAEDPAMQHNLLNDARYTAAREKLTLYCRTVIQQYNNALIENRLNIR